MSSLTYRDVLVGNRSFRRLWTGQVVSELGNWFNFIAGLGLVRAVSGAAPEATAILIVLRLAPFALFAPLAGAIVDRFSRRAVMFWTDIARALFALGFLLVGDAGDLWIAYVCTFVSTVLSAFFEGAKNASLPHVVGDRGLLVGNALMYSSRFLLMSIGSALGGAASAVFGYKVAFAVNALSFLVSAYSIWLIPERDLRAADNSAEKVAGTSGPEGEERQAETRRRGGYLRDVGDGWRYILRHPLVAAIIGINILWATGGGALQLVYEQLGAFVYAPADGLSEDAAVAMLYTAIGAGLFLGMFMARRVGIKVEVRGVTAGFMGWAIILHGLLFALAGLMPTLWLSMLLMFLSRVVIGVEFAVQETLLMRMLPDGFRGRVMTTDRAAEIFTMSLTTALAGWLLGFALTPRSLTVISGLLCGLPGIFWLLLFASGKLRMPAAGARKEEGAFVAAD